MLTLLYIDNNPDTCTIIDAFCERIGSCTVQILNSGQAAREWLSWFRADVIVSDHSLPGGVNGIELLLELRSYGNATPFILFTADNSRKLKKEACRNGAFCVIPKAPFGKNTIYLLIRTANWAAHSGQYRSVRRTCLNGGRSSDRKNARPGIPSKKRPTWM